jgi:enamine deaminase RidA (YjgF/YER057c/UK114 family)
LGIAVAGAAGGAVFAGGGVSASAQNQLSEIQALFPAGAPAAAPGYSPGIAASGSRVVFVSGQGPADLKADMETQMRQTFDRIGLVLKAAGADFKHIVMLRAYFVHMARDLPVYRKVRLDYLREPYPASTAVGTTELAIPGLEIEIEAVAIMGPP